jgi:hypothetical protein
MEKKESTNGAIIISSNGYLIYWDRHIAPYANQ